MPDISKCSGAGCPDRDTCYRYTSAPSRYQSYSDFWRDLSEGAEKCGFYWEDDDA